MADYKDEVRQSSGMSRRGFVKASATAAAALAVSGGLAGCGPNKVQPTEEDQQAAPAADIISVPGSRLHAGTTAEAVA